MNCLICYRKTHEKITKNIKITDFFKDFNSKEAAISTELSVIFVIQNILDVPSSFCEKLISSEGNPSSWGINLCTVCERVVHEAQFIFQRIKKFVEEFDELKGKLKGVAQNSLKDADKKSSASRKRNVTNVTDVLRLGFFKSYSADAEPEKTIKKSISPQKNGQQQKTVDIEEEEEDPVEVKLEPMDIDHEENPVAENPLLENILENFGDNDDDHNDPLSFHMDADDDHLSTEENQEIVQNQNATVIDENGIEHGDSDGLKYVQLRNGRIGCPIELCSFSFESKFYAKAHVQRYHYGNETPYMCSKCKMAFCRPKMLRMHKCEIDNEVDPSGLKFFKLGDGKFTCPIQKCQYTFESKFFAKAHVERYHYGNTSPYKCEKCSSSFQRPSQWKAHKCRKRSKFATYRRRVNLQIKNVRSIVKKEVVEEETEKPTDVFENEIVVQAGPSATHEERHVDMDIEDNISSHSNEGISRRSLRERKPVKRLVDVDSDDNNDDDPKSPDWKANSEKEESDIEFEVAERGFRRPLLKSIKRPIFKKIRSGGIGRTPKPRPHKFEFHCEHCPFRSFDKQFKLDGHILRMHQNIERPFECDLCDRRFMRIANVMYHIDRCHPENSEEPEPKPEETSEHPKPDDLNEDSNNGATNNDETLTESVQNENKDSSKPIIKSRQYTCKKNYPDRPNACYECGFPFKYMYQLDAHILRVHYGDDAPFRCECKRKFQRFSELDKHRSNFHPDIVTPYQGVYDAPKNQEATLDISLPCRCPLCNERFQDIGPLDEHMNNDHGLKRTTTEEIPIKTVLKPIPKKPIIDGIKLQPHKCPECEKQFPSSLKCEAHIRRVHTRPNSTVICQECGSHFLTKKGLEEHMNLGHTKDGKWIGVTPGLPPGPSQQKIVKEKRRFMCEFCTNTYTMQIYLENHQRQVHHEELGESPIICETCGKKLSCERTLDHHIMTVHTNNAPNKCEFCPRTFIFESQLKVHIRLAHTLEKPFKCTHSGCERAFAKEVYLRNHQRVHSGEKPFKCKECPREFSDQPTYRRHLETHGDKIHKCPNCGREFKVWHSFRTHMKTHNKEPGTSSRKPSIPKNSKRKIELASSESEDSDDSYSDGSDVSINITKRGINKIQNQATNIPSYYVEPAPPILQLQVPGPVPEINNEWQSQENFPAFPNLINNSLNISNGSNNSL